MSVPRADHYARHRALNTKALISIPGFTSGINSDFGGREWGKGDGIRTKQSLLGLDRTRGSTQNGNGWGLPCLVAG